MSNQDWSELQVIGVRYRASKPARGDERALDAYLASGVYEQSQVPFDIVESVLSEEKRLDEETENLGLLGGIVAEEVASARRAGKAILMTGGDCNHITGVIGGLQHAHGPAARIG